MMGNSAPGPSGTKSVRGSASSTGDSWGGPRHHNQWADCVGEAHKGKFKPSGVHFRLHPTALYSATGPSATCKGCAQGRVWQIPAGPWHTPPCRSANTYFLFFAYIKHAQPCCQENSPQSSMLPQARVPHLESGMPASGLVLPTVSGTCGELRRTRKHAELI